MKNSNVRLWFSQVVQANRILNAYNTCIADLFAYNSRQLIDNTNMKRANGAHNVNLPIKKFNTVVLCKDATLAHTSIIINRKLFPNGHCNHLLFS